MEMDVALGTFSGCTLTFLSFPSAFERNQSFRFIKYLFHIQNNMIPIASVDLVKKVPDIVQIDFTQKTVTTKIDFPGTIQVEVPPIPIPSPSHSCLSTIVMYEQSLTMVVADYTDILTIVIDILNYLGFREYYYLWNCFRVLDSRGTSRLTTRCSSSSPTAPGPIRNSPISTRRSGRLLRSSIGPI